MDDADVESKAANQVSFTEELDLFLREQHVDFEPNDISTVIKCTRIAEYKNNTYNRRMYHSPPRFRACTTIHDTNVNSSRSLKTGIPMHNISAITSLNTKRKIATIAEDDENDLHPRFSSRNEKNGSYRRAYKPHTNRSELPQSAKSLPNRQFPYKNTLQCMRYTQARPANAKVNNTDANKKPPVVDIVKRNRSPCAKPAQKSNVSPNLLHNGDSVQSKNIRESSKDTSNRSSFSNNSRKSNLVRESSAEQINFIKNALINRKAYASPSRSEGMHSAPSREKIKLAANPRNVIHVPIEKKRKTRNRGTSPDNNSLKMKHEETEISKVKLYRESFALTDSIRKDAGSVTDPTVPVCDVAIGTENEEEDKPCQSDFAVSSVDCQTGKQYDSLNVPSISLLDNTYIDEVLSKISNKNIKLHSASRSMPNFYVSPNEEERLLKSYIIGRATLTYMTKQSINFRLVDETDVNTSQINPVKCPLSVLSIYKNELKKRDSMQSNNSDRFVDVQSKTSHSFKLEKSRNKVTPFLTDKLIKPSDVIRTIKLNSDLLPNHFITEQFQKELNFIDSFFESLQYLENGSLSDKVADLDKKAQSSYEIDSSDYNKFLSNLECSDSDDCETMASKSLCLLNHLIRDEQRRAKNLLFVLKMREDALKDFTKSQIIWLENKKKRDHTDISALKKKQRGALLRLQHECGEMQRMRKALLALSEKRKSALMKTKKSIEQKLNTNIDIDKLLTNKRKLRTSTSVDRTTPIKCFDLSSSNEESNQSTTQVAPHKLAKIVSASLKPLMSEKSIQTNDPAHTTSESTVVAQENYVVVDGKYLNILFQNMSLPQIFHVGKQYEVNEEALQVILYNVNSQSDIAGSDVLVKFVEQLCKEKSSVGGKSSTPSTARSLLEELDQYYKEDNKDFKERETSIEDDDYDSANKVFELSDIETQSDGLEESHTRGTCTSGVMLRIMDLSKTMENTMATGPLPVPPGASTDSPGELRDWISSSKMSSNSFSTFDKSDISSSSDTATLSATSSHVDCEAERLRQQQLAIEREIKALEEQQCLMVVREIPDKPPPPYTPPADGRPATYAKFSPEVITEESILECLKKRLRGQSTKDSDELDSFDLFIQDYCFEVTEGMRVHRSESPWDACNLLPQKPELDLESLVKKTFSDIKEVLSATPPPSLSGISMRRGDQGSDDNNVILSEWRRCEAEWTSLHVDEVAVKNRIFENIFQKILSETVDEYKKLFCS